MDTQLDHLQPQFQVKVFELLARAVEARVPIMVVNTFRTASEQADAFKRGVSWVSHSKHQDGLAVDLAPVAVFLLHGQDKLQWDPADPVWTVLGVMGERLGLVWGGRWPKPKTDLGHFEQGT